jgi:polyphosphate glucokinase
MGKDTIGKRILSIDIGGSHVKAVILNQEGEMQMEYKKIVTPPSPTPKMLIATIKTLVKDFPAYDNISVGFPGYVKKGVIFTAPNLGTKPWVGFDLAKALEKEFGKPAQVVNDADMQGIGVVDGKGFELVVTLGTGFGTALLMDGVLLPHLELAHLPVTKSKTYDTYIGEKALVKEGLVKWNERLKYVLNTFKTVFNYDRLYIGGGNASKINFKLDSNITIVSNRDGIKGGARLWQAHEQHEVVTAAANKKS